MSLTIFNDGDHPAGFIGIRVAVMVNKKHRQRYFNFRDKLSRSGFVSQAEEARLRKEARALEKQWQEDKAKAFEKFKLTAGTSGRALLKTNVRGLVCRFKPCIRRTGECSTHKLRLMLHIKHNGERATKSITVNHLSEVESCWREMTRELAKARGLKRALPQWNKCCPDTHLLQQAYQQCIEQYGEPERCGWTSFIDS